MRDIALVTLILDAHTDHKVHKLTLDPPRYEEGGCKTAFFVLQSFCLMLVNARHEDGVFTGQIYRRLT